MDSKYVMRQLRTLEGLSGKAKMAHLKTCLEDANFRLVMLYALNPFWTYGVGKVKVFEALFSRSEPVHGQPGGNVTFDLTNKDDGILGLLEGLKERRINDAVMVIGFHANLLDPESAELLRRILLKDLRCGVTEVSVNKLMKDLIPVFNCMLAHPFEVKRVKTWPMMVEEKLDGMRVLGIVKGDDVEFVSRTGKLQTSLDHLKEPLLELIAKKIVAHFSNERDRHIYEEGIVFDGEVVAASFNETVSQVRKKEKKAEDAVFTVFDIVPYRFFIEEKFPLKFRFRRQLVTKFIPREGAIRHSTCYLVNSEEEIMAIYGSVRSRNGEGVIVKNPDAPYVCKRSHDWGKIKAEETVDLRVVGYYRGEGKYSEVLGGLVVKRYNREDICIGGGFSDDQRHKIWKKLHDSPDEIIGSIIEINYHEVTSDGSLRHPRFKKFRHDKTVADDELEVAA
ncbi:RNA ligase family protein [Ectothiorhodospira shaposhnikovii]|uniref:ATP-dependent DNA ligase n=1 Tax=Ectothiorhodospira shaposhnikovii TaxID=1054 RepID=UPI001EE81871|nr:RNA ligase family protein [Ectothiorhodospira shaposhnikovii]MCG5512881.1 hypothetical protein [Ectothiorhodospira shaposhnikovii]